MNSQDQRIQAHNNWPKREEFKAERAFRDRLASKGGDAPFKPISLGKDTDKTYHVCIGHFLDALEALPNRPDQFFDHCFRVIDESARPLFNKQGIKGIVQGLAGKLLSASNDDWQAIVDELGAHIPLMTCRYLAKRMLQVHGSTNDLEKQLSGRVEKCLTKKTYDAFAAKFGTDPANSCIERAASFLKLYLSGKPASKSRGSAYKLLDLHDPKNVPSYQQRIEFLLSVLLFTMRNERAHGGVLSAFRTSKGTLERYESYYFSMLCTYVFAAGILSLRGFGGVSSALIRKCATDNILLQKKFFA
ncbi:hypothetical protein [Methyloversatilis discipulorum]|jgi:hypothetical protein|uniref:hypothetical protein n=1 Tax=Methyloversatilis discipulorum TaxID=1119528 RepID=UPI0031380A21